MLQIEANSYHFCTNFSLYQAIRGQIKALVAAEGANTPLERELVRELKQVCYVQSLLIFNLI
jgi:hypothetical protein